MRTRDVMSSPVVTVAPDVHLKDVAATLVERGINAVPVVEEGDRLVGIVTEADLLTLEAALTSGARPGSLAAWKGPPHTAGEVMSRSVYTLTEDTDATEAARLMLRHRLKSVPVVAGDRVVGIVARRDLLRLVARGDNDIRADLQHRLQEEVHALQRLDLHVGRRGRDHRRSRRPVGPPAGGRARPHRARCPRGPLDHLQRRWPVTGSSPTSGRPAQTRSVSRGSAGRSSVAMRTTIWCSAACLMASGDASAETPRARRALENLARKMVRASAICAGSSTSTWAVPWSSRPDP